MVVRRESPWTARGRRQPRRHSIPRRLAGVLGLLDQAPVRRAFSYAPLGATSGGLAENRSLRAGHRGAAHGWV